MPLLKKLPHGNLYRAKANLFVRQNKQIINGKHETIIWSKEILNNK